MLALPPDEKDELNNVYVRSAQQLMETDPSRRFPVEFKSVVLDLVEKHKTLQRVAESMQLADPAEEAPEDLRGSRVPAPPAPRAEERSKRAPRLDARAVRELPEGLLYRFRKCRRG